MTVVCENLWPILYYLGGPLLALSSGSSRMYRKSTDKLLWEVYSLSLFYRLKLQLILLLTVLLSLPINDLPYLCLFFGLSLCLFFKKFRKSSQRHFQIRCYLVMLLSCNELWLLDAESSLAGLFIGILAWRKNCCGL